MLPVHSQTLRIEIALKDLLKRVVEEPDKFISTGLIKADVYDQALYINVVTTLGFVFAKGYITPESKAILKEFIVYCANKITEVETSLSKNHSASAISGHELLEFTDSVVNLCKEIN